ncbi:MAG TPA: hypothetical protein VE083_01475 [Terriglobales bacterium]|nr:hypothetical protein [Terriglobales bacterium]
MESWFVLFVLREHFTRQVTHSMTSQTPPGSTPGTMLLRVGQRSTMRRHCIWSSKRARADPKQHTIPQFLFERTARENTR